MQLSLLPEARRLEKQEELESVVDGLRSRFGHFSVQRGIMLTDRKLSDLDPVSYTHLDVYKRQAL